MSEWYYVEEGRQVGPLSETELQRAVSDGRITPETLVWREGLESWISFRDLFETGKAPTALAQPQSMVWCAECGQPIPEDSAISFGPQHVCAGCKATFLQRLKEGGHALAGVPYAGLGIRFVAVLLDLFVFALIGAGLYLLLVAVGLQTSFQRAIENETLQILLSLPITALEVFFVYKYGATPGKLMLKLKIVRADGGKLTFGQAVGRCVWSTILSAIPWVGSPLYGLDCLKAHFNPEHRAFHDDLFGTRVIHTDR